jgi:hypothetical protein
MINNRDVHEFCDTLIELLGLDIGLTCIGPTLAKMRAVVRAAEDLKSQAEVSET